MVNLTLRRGTTAILVSLLFLSLWVGQAAALDADAGTAGFAFLKIAQNARLVSMGSAAVGEASDAAAFQINPAGLAQQRRRTWSATYSNLYADVQSGFVSYSMPVESETVVGASLTYLTSTGIPRRGQFNEDLGTYSFSDIALALSVGTRLLGGPDTLAPELPELKRRMRIREFHLDAGVSLRGIYEKLDTYSANGVSVDLGLLAHLPDDRTRIGLSLTHLGSQTSGFGDATDGLPTALITGFRHRLRGAPLLVVADMSIPADNKIRFGVGGELTLGGSKSEAAPLALRVGYNTQGRDLRTTADDSGIAGLSFGAGLHWRVYRLDYSYTPGLGLGTLHRFTLWGQIL
jgi:hypothetical protein